jgi:hypothetical protein
VNGLIQEVGDVIKRLCVGVIAMVIVSAAVAGCSSDDRRSINEAVARNAVAAAGAKQFGDSGYAVKGLLHCKTQSKTTTKVTVACTGTTEKDEQAAALLGSTSDARQVKGTFVGTVDGKQVFKTDCLGC